MVFRVFRVLDGVTYLWVNYSNVVAKTSFERAISQPGFDSGPGHRLAKQADDPSGVDKVVAITRKWVTTVADCDYFLVVLSDIVA